MSWAGICQRGWYRIDQLEGLDGVDLASFCCFLDLWRESGLIFLDAASR
jgi:hypothetical protein